MEADCGGARCRGVVGGTRRSVWGRILCRAWSGGVSVLLDWSVAPSRFRNSTVLARVVERADGVVGLASVVVCTYDMYMPNKTISVPDDVVPIIESLEVPFSKWVTEQLRRYAALSTMSFAEQVLADAALAMGERLTDRDAVAAGERMERSAPW